MIENFIEFMKENRLSENTYNSYANDIKIFEKYYEDSYGEKLTTLIHVDIISYRNYMFNHNYSPATINRKIAALKQYNLFLINQNIQENLIITDKDYIKIQHSMLTKELPSQQEINKLIHLTCKDSKNAKRDYCIITLFVYGGLRESEMVKLRVIDIKLKDRFINIIGKGNKFRQVVINSYMFDSLQEYLEERNNMKIKNPYLFIGQKNKNTLEAMNRNFCNRLLNKYNETCKINNLHPHLLRSFFCTNALHNAGYSIEQVANQAGHYSLNTTKGYLVTKQEDLLSLANRL